MSKSSRILQPVTNPEKFICKVTKRIERYSAQINEYFKTDICKICMDDETCNDMPLKCCHKLCKVCYFEIDNCPFCRKPYKETIVMDLSNKYDLTNESAAKPLLTKWSKCDIWELIKVIDEFHGYLSQADIDESRVVTYGRRINVYLNRHLFVKQCFVIDGKIFIDWVDCISGIILKDMYHMTNDPIEMENLFGSLMFLMLRLKTYSKEKLGILKNHRLIPNPEYFKKY